jgi:hypothetical protein
VDGPQTPYRAGKPLAEIIPPDRRRAKTLALVLASMALGVALWVLGGMVLDLRRELRPPPIGTAPVGYQAGRITPSVLGGPGLSAVMPPRERAVLHVWLQGCQDCMPKFEAMRALESAGGLGVTVPIYNVAYEEADPTWAARYGVQQNLVFDVGGRSVVKPLGIGTFTTLVVDPDGSILLRDQPDRPGYRDRVRAAVGAANVLPTPTPSPDDPLGPPGDQGAPLDAEAVRRVVAAHAASLKRACWEPRLADRDGPSAASVTVTATIGGDGRVDATRATGDDAPLQKCLEAQVAKWRFPGSGATKTVSLPFRFAKQ